LRQQRLVQSESYRRQHRTHDHLRRTRDRLHVIHLAAGQPSMREIANTIGRGVVSSSTVHNMFRGPRVPKWGFLELVVEELDGDIAEFRKLWQAARLAEEAADNPGTTNAAGNGGPAGPLRRVNGRA